MSKWWQSVNVMRAACEALLIDSRELDLVLIADLAKVIEQIVIDAGLSGWQAGCCLMCGAYPDRHEPWCPEFGTPDPNLPIECDENDLDAAEAALEAEEAATCERLLEWLRLPASFLALPPGSISDNADDP